jgi:plastocyanin
MAIRYLQAFQRTAALCALSLGTWATIAAGAAAPKTVSVDITKFAFSPKEVTVEPGTRVKWTNHDETPHTVSSQPPGKTFASKALDTDDQFEFVFATEGDYPYICTVHPFMAGMVHVRKEGAR